MKDFCFKVLPHITAIMTSYNVTSVKLVALNWLAFEVVELDCTYIYMFL